jgi:hypothetical protein
MYFVVVGRYIMFWILTSSLLIVPYHHEASFFVSVIAFVSESILSDLAIATALN